MRFAFYVPPPEFDDYQYTNMEGKDIAMCNEVM